jgi:hypothetical protein
VDSTPRTEWYGTRLTIYMKGCPYRSRARRRERKTRLLVSLSVSVLLMNNELW